VHTAVGVHTRALSRRARLSRKRCRPCVVRASVTRGCTACMRYPHHLAPPCVSTPPRVQPLGDDSRVTSVTFARARHARQGSPREGTEPSDHTSSPPAARALCPSSSTRRRLGALNKWENRRCRLLRPHTAIRRPLVTSPPHALLTPTYSLPRTLPRNSSWCFHSSSRPPPPAYPCVCDYERLAPFASHASGSGFESVCVFLSFSLAPAEIFVRPVGLLSAESAESAHAYVYGWWSINSWSIGF